MSVETAVEQQRRDPQAVMAELVRDGSASLPGSFSQSWGRELAQDFEQLLEEALGREGGTVPRGPRRHYFAVHPERLRGFVDLVTHPSVTDLCELMLGPRYQVVEVAFDVPLPGAVHQPWHRDFAMPEVTARERRLTSLAFNVTTVDVEPDMGPFEIAPGTHWDDGSAFGHGMFPRRNAYPRYDALGRCRHPKLGDMSVRTGLTIHRGTPNVSQRARGVLVLGVVAAEVETDVHSLAVSTAYEEALPGQVRAHLRRTVVPALTPIVQQHSIEGLVMGG